MLTSVYIKKNNKTWSYVVISSEKIFFSVFLLSVPKSSNQNCSYDLIRNDLLTK